MLPCSNVIVVFEMFRMVCNVGNVRVGWLDTSLSRAGALATAHSRSKSVPRHYHHTSDCSLSLSSLQPVTVETLTQSVVSERRHSATAIVS